MNERLKARGEMLIDEHIIEVIGAIAISSTMPDHDIARYCEEHGIEYDADEICDKLLDVNIERCCVCEHFFYSHDMEFTSEGSLCIDCGGVPEGMEDE